MKKRGGIRGVAQTGRPETQPDGPIDFVVSFIEIYECTASS